MLVIERNIPGAGKLTPAELQAQGSRMLVRLRLIQLLRLRGSGQN
jgi:hypothetical protein